jgi:dihydroorotate dehydrogenase (NAD+) catalytic subunit
MVGDRQLATPQRRLGTVVENRKVGPYHLLRVADPASPTPEPGQFAMVAAVRGWGGEGGERPYLPRPYSYAGFEAGVATFLLEAVGPGSARLASLTVGEEVWLLGPLGRPFQRREGLCLACGGGTGIAPLVFLANRGGVPVEACFGFASGAGAAVAKELLPSAAIATEDGSAGWRGTALDLLWDRLVREDGPAWICSCGPPGLLEGVRRTARERGIPCQLALEAPMACGYGACHGCVVLGADRAFHRVCTEGPVFWAEELAPLDAPQEGVRYPNHPPLSMPPAPLRQGPVSFLGLSLAHPLINGSGTFDLRGALAAFGAAIVERFPFAAFVSKTITLHPRPGNPPPRLWEGPAGLINSIGLPNPGLERYIAEELPLLRSLPVPLITNVMGREAAELRELFAAISDQEGVAAIELNASCPNVADGLELGATPRLLERTLSAARPAAKVPVIVKLTPNTTSPEEAARAAAAGGADGLSLINTVAAAGWGREGRVPAVGGGLSGPAVRPIALGQLERVAKAVPLPLVGIGGVQSAADARAFLEAGATLVGVGTESFRDPLAARRIALELGFRPVCAQGGASTFLEEDKVSVEL